MKKNLKKSKKGFTLIELVVVIAILGILAAILVPVVGGFISKANDSANLANAKALYNTGMMYYATTGKALATSADPIDTQAELTALGATHDFVILFGTTWPIPKGKGASDVFAIYIDTNGAVTVKLAGQTYQPGTASFS